jgi:hypothetical protein
MPSDIEEVEEVEDELESEGQNEGLLDSHHSLHQVQEEESLIDEPVLASNLVTSAGGGDKDNEIEDEYICL